LQPERRSEVASGAATNKSADPVGDSAQFQLVARVGMHELIERYNDGDFPLFLLRLLPSRITTCAFHGHVTGIRACDEAMSRRRAD